MKRTYSLLLALLMLMTVATSCTVTVTDPSNTSESESSESETSDEPGTSVAIEYETIVSIGKKYTVSVAPDSKYPDSFGTELCDGIHASEGAGFTDDKFSGYSVGNGGKVSVIFDMGTDNIQLYKFGISYLSTRNAGIGPIGISSVSYSNDGETWARTGRGFIIPKFEEGVIQEAWSTLDQPIDARYIRFDVRSTSSWIFLDELTVIANAKESSVNKNYLENLSAAYTANLVNSSSLTQGTTAVDFTQVESSVSTHCTYKLSRSSSNAFPDTAAKLLTDGNASGSSLESQAYVGFDDGKALDITLDLGKKYSDLSVFELSMYQHANLHYMLPYYVDVKISGDGTLFSNIGRIYATSNLSATNFTFSLRLSKGLTARYIRFSLPETDSKMFLIEEANVGYYGEMIQQSYYPSVILPEVDAPTVRPGASSEMKNLVLGLPYQISSGTLVENTSAVANANTKASAGILTDGKTGNTANPDSGWNKTSGGLSRSVFFDLGYSCSVSKLSVGYLNYSGWAIKIPSSTTLYLSENGIDWYSVGNTQTLNPSASRAEQILELEHPVRARFVCVSFPVSPHTYADEIEVYGSEAVSSDAILPSEMGVHPFTKGQYAAPNKNLLEGVSDVALIYYNIVPGDEDYFLPYVAYLDENGNIKDTLFDGYLFLPSTAGTGFPTKGKPYYAPSEPTSASDWDYQFTHNFTSGIDFDALNKTTAKVKEALSLPADYTVKVYATIMYPTSTSTGFPGYDFKKLEDRLRYIDTYMDRYMDEFKKARYEHLTFGGFYWFHEAIVSEPEEQDVLLIQETAKLAESKGSQLFWIPYYIAPGFFDWSSYGFSVACMQPNYVFNDTKPLSQLHNAVEYIKALGMCIEIEIDTSTLNQLNLYKRYMQYLGYGVEAGYMTDCIHMYYQSGATYCNACHSDNPMSRMIYEATYRFIKGTIVAPEKLDDLSYTCESGKFIEGKLFDNPLNLNIAQLFVSAEHGSVSVSPDGSFVYVPHEGFTGTDTFQFKYSDYLCWSEATSVTVTVG